MCLKASIAPSRRSAIGGHYVVISASIVSSARGGFTKQDAASLICIFIAQLNGGFFLSSLHLRLSLR
jgi:hypothetical protein